MKLQRLADFHGRCSACCFINRNAFNGNRILLRIGAAFRYISATGIIVRERQLILAVDCNDKTLSLNITAASAIVTVAHAAGCTIIELDGLAAAGRR